MPRPVFPRGLARPYPSWYGPSRTFCVLDPLSIISFMTSRPHIAACILLAFLAPTNSLKAESPSDDGARERAYVVHVMTRLADPVLNALSENKLKEKMPKLVPSRAQFQYLEAFGRLMAGMAPWLELGPGDDDEGKLRAHYIKLAVQCIGNATDPQSPDYMDFSEGSQPVVDAAFFAQALLRAPTQLWGNLDAKTQANVIAALKSTKRTAANTNNWVLFSATVDAALWKYSNDYTPSVLKPCVQKQLTWYKGDGTYGDGSNFHWDYYNSYVIQPMLIGALQVCIEKKDPLGAYYPLIIKRAQRYAAIEERMISPEGTFPVMGRSSTYRFGAFHLLALMALMEKLPRDVEPAQVRAALDSVMHRMMESPKTFDEDGWLRPGSVGYQPSLQEEYISSGSPYLCSEALVTLGLPANNPYWQGPDLPWSQKKIWSGVDVPRDHASD